MANFTRSNNAASSNVQARDEAWKSRGFLNFYFPTTGGGDDKLGFIGLKLAVPGQKRAAEWLECTDIIRPTGMTDEQAEKFDFDLAEEQGKRLAKFMSKMKVVYRSAEKTDNGGLDLS
jgi:hypothetical protein